MSDTYSDPFAPAGVEQTAPGASVPSDFWRNLTAFGAATMAGANARTPQGFLANGNGPLGPIGVGLQAGLEQANKTAQLRSSLGLQGAQASNLRAEAGLHGAQVKQMNQAMDLFNQMINGGGGLGMPSGAPQASALPSGGSPNPYASASPPPGQLSDTVTQAAAKYGIPPAIANWFGFHESGWNPQASNVNNDPNAGPVTHAGGMWQFEPGTAKQYGLSDPTDPAASTDAAMRYIRDLAIKNNGDWMKVADQYGTTHTGKGTERDAMVRAGLQQYLASNGLIGPSAATGQTIGQQASATPPPVQAGGFAPYQVAQAGPSPIPVPGPPQQPAGHAPIQMNGLPSVMQSPEWQAGSALANRAAAFSLNPYTAAFGKPSETQASKLLDLATVGPAAAAKAAQTITTDRFGNRYQGNQYIGRGPEVKEVWNPATQQYEWGDVGALGPDMQPIGGGTPPAAKPGPLTTEFQHKYGEELGNQFEKIDTDAASAKDSNYLFDNLRNDSQTWQMGKFADFEGDARAYLSAIAGSFGIATPELNQKLSDYQAFNKSSGMLLRTAVHDTSSRAAVQEYSMIGKTLPQPTTSAEGFGQVADQWQGLNDFRMAKQKVKQGYMGNPQDFNVDFNSNVSPTAFMINRMMQTPMGQHNFQLMMSRMQETPEGRQTISHIMKGYNYARQNNLFDGLPPESGPTQTQP